MLCLDLDIGCRKTSLSLRFSTQPSSSLSSPSGRARNQRAASDSTFPLSRPHLVGWHTTFPYLALTWLVGTCAPPTFVRTALASARRAPRLACQPALAPNLDGCGGRCGCPTILVSPSLKMVRVEDQERNHWRCSGPLKISWLVGIGARLRCAPSGRGRWSPVEERELEKIRRGEQSQSSRARRAASTYRQENQDLVVPVT